VFVSTAEVSLLPPKDTTNDALHLVALQVLLDKRTPWHGRRCLAPGDAINVGVRTSVAPRKGPLTACTTANINSLSLIVVGESNQVTDPPAIPYEANQVGFEVRFVILILVKRFPVVVIRGFEERDMKTEY